MTNWIEKYQAGKIFLQPNSSKLPGGYRIPYKDRSSELAISIDGENGEPAYLIPSFKYGIPLKNPVQEFKDTGEHLGGPFKTWQEADKWGKEIRHPYVEKGQPIPSPIRTWGKEFQNGGSVSSSRKDYLRQQYQNYLKSQAEKGRKAVTDATDKFSRDYVIPAIKTVGSFTPAGFFIGLADAYEAYQQGNTGWALAGAGMEALPYVGKGIGKGVKALSNTLIDNKDAIKLAYYNKAPWTWKPNPNYYYRAGKGSEFLDDVIERNEIRAFNPNSYVYLRDQGLINGIRDVNTGKITLKAKTFPIADTYWSKGVPLDGRYTNQNYGDHIIEASDDIPFVNSVNQRTKQKGFWDSPDINYNSTHVRGSYVKPRQSYGYNEKGEIQSSIGTPLLYDANKIKLYKPHWLKGYKEIPKKGKGGFIPIAQEGVSIRSDDRNWLQRFNDKVYSGYQEHKPQLFKDFPITDLPGMMVEYITGHGDPEAGISMVAPISIGKSSQINKIINKNKTTSSIGNFYRNAEGKIDYLPTEEYINAVKQGKYDVVDYISDPRYKNVVENNQKLSNRLNIQQTPLPIERQYNLPLHESRVQQIQSPLHVDDPRVLEQSLLKGETATTAQYTRTLGGKGSITIPRIYPADQVTRSARHESLHHVYPNLGEGYPSFTKVEEMKIKNTFKSPQELRKIEEASNAPLWYLDDADELIPNTFDMASEMGISKFQSYPGKEKFIEMLNQYNGPKKFIKDALKLETSRDYKRAWDLMTGVRAAIIPAAIGVGTAKEKFQKGGTIPKAQEGVRIKSDDRNWLERFNDKVYGEYQEHKPQLLKDFPLLDLPGMMVEYVTGHSDPEIGGISMLPAPVLRGLDKKLVDVTAKGMRNKLSKTEIAKEQLEKLGITSTQREGYLPGVSELLYKKVDPRGYPGSNNLSWFLRDLKNQLSGNPVKIKALKEQTEQIVGGYNQGRDDAWRMYLGLPQKYKTFRIAEAQDIGTYFPHKKGSETFSLVDSPHSFFPPPVGKYKVNSHGPVMGNYGEYTHPMGIEHYDFWDLEPVLPIKYRGKPVKLPVSKVIGKPFETRGMRYVDEDMRKLFQQLFGTREANKLSYLGGSKGNLQKGGTIPKAQEGTALRRPTEDFMNIWTTSPMHSKMLERSSPKDYNNIQKGRLENLANTSVQRFKEIPSDIIDYGGDRLADSNPDTGVIRIFDQDLDRQKGLITHEKSHSSDRPLRDFKWKMQNFRYNNGIDKELVRDRLIPQSDIDLISKFKPKNFRELPDYVEAKRSWENAMGPMTQEDEAGQFMIRSVDYYTDPTEVRARLNDLREKAYINKIYNPLKEKVSSEQFRKLISNLKIRKGTHPLMDLQKIFSDDEIMIMLNLISENQDNSNKSEELPQAKNGGTIPKAQEGVKIQADRRNWLQRTNDKIQTTYNKNKPQLLKDFPLLDLPGMMVEYVTGHSEDPDAGLAMVNPIGKIGKAIKVQQAASKFKAKEKGINFVKNWIEHPESQKRINEITDLSDAEVLNQAFKNILRLNPGASPEKIKRYIEGRAFLIGINGRLKKDLGVLGPELFSTKNLNRGYLVPKNRILNKGDNKSGVTGLSWGKGNFWIARETPRKTITSNTVHEATHNLTGNRDNIKIKKLTDEAFGGELVLEKLRQANPQYVNDINYFSDPTEVYARVMELRNQFKLKPGQIVDKKLGKKIFTKGVLDKTPVDTKFFKLMQTTRQDLPKKGGAWFTDLFNKLPAATPIGIVGSSMYMNNQNKDKE